MEYNSFKLPSMISTKNYIFLLHSHCLSEQAAHFLCLFFVLGWIFAKINISLLSASVHFAWKTPPTALITLFVAGRRRLGDTQGTMRNHQA